MPELTAYSRSRPQHVANNRIAAPTLSAVERDNYSLVRAIDAAREGNWREAAFERDVTLDMLDRHGDPDRNPHRLIVPASVLLPQRRDLTAASASGGGYLIDSPVLGVVDALRPSSVVMRLGARTLTGLRGGATYARQGGTATITWMATEATQASETSTLSLGSLAVSAKTVSAYIEQSYHLRRMAPDLAEAVTRNDLRNSLATALDVAALNGSGVSGVPLGILNTPSIGTFTGASLAYAGLLEAQTDVLTNNALGGVGDIAFTCRPAVASLLANRLGFSTVSPMWVGPLSQGELAHCRAVSTMNMPADTLLAGDFGQMLIAEFGVGLEIAVNPYAGFQAGIEGYRAIMSVDVATLVREAFTVATSVS